MKRAITTRELLLKRGLKQGTIEYDDAKRQLDKERERKRWAKRYAKQKTELNRRARLAYSANPEWAALRNKRRRERYKNDPAFRKRDLDRRNKWFQDHRVHTRKRMREWYHRTKHEKHHIYVASRTRNRPLYGLKEALRKFNRGELSIHELDRLYKRASQLVDDRVKRVMGQQKQGKK